MGAAFRYGHSETNTALQRVDENGAILEPVLVRDGYFNPIPIRVGGIETFIRGAVYQIQQKVDTVYVDGLFYLFYLFIYFFYFFDIFSIFIVFKIIIIIIIIINKINSIKIR